MIAITQARLTGRASYAQSYGAISEVLTGRMTGHPDCNPKDVQRDYHNQQRHTTGARRPRDYRYVGVQTQWAKMPVAVQMAIFLIACMSRGT
jgi:hypothetical protein